MCSKSLFWMAPTTQSSHTWRWQPTTKLRPIKKPTMAKRVASWKSELRIQCRYQSVLRDADNTTHIAASAPSNATALHAIINKETPHTTRLAQVRTLSSTRTASVACAECARHHLRGCFDCIVGYFLYTLKGHHSAFYDFSYVLECFADRHIFAT